MKEKENSEFNISPGQASSSYLDYTPTVILAAAQGALMSLIGYGTHDVTMLHYFCY